MAEEFQELRNELIRLVREEIGNEDLSVEDACVVVTSSASYSPVRERMRLYLQKQAQLSREVNAEPQSAPESGKSPSSKRIASRAYSDIRLPPLGQSTYFLGRHLVDKAVVTLKRHTNSENTYPCMQALITLMRVPTAEIIQSAEWSSLCALLIHNTVIRNMKLFPVVVDMLLKIYNSSSPIAVRDAFKAVQNGIIIWTKNKEYDDASNLHKLVRLWHRMIMQFSATFVRFPPATVAELSLSTVTFLSHCTKSSTPNLYHPIQILNSIDPQADWFKALLSSWIGRERISSCSTTHPEFFSESLKKAYLHCLNRDQSQCITYLHITFLLLRYKSMRQKLFPLKIENKEQKMKLNQVVLLRKLVENLDYCTLNEGEVIIDGILNLTQFDPEILMELPILESIMCYLNKDTFGEYFSKLMKVSLLLINFERPMKNEDIHLMMNDFKRDVLTLCSIRNDNDEINNIVSQLLKECRIEHQEMQNASIPDEIQTVEKLMADKRYPINILEELSQQIKLIKLFDPLTFQKLGHTNNTNLSGSSQVIFDLINLPGIESCFQEPSIKKWVQSVFEAGRKSKTPKVRVWAEVMKFVTNNLDLCLAMEKGLNISEKILKYLKTAEVDGELELTEKHSLMVEVFLNIKIITGPSETSFNGDSTEHQFPNSSIILEHQIGSFFQAEPSRFLIKRANVGPADLPRDLVHYLLKISESRQRLPHQEVLHKYASMHINSSTTLMYSSPQDWSSVIEYGNNLKLFPDIRKVLIESKQLQQDTLYPRKSRGTSNSIDWFSGCVLLLLDGESAQTSAFLHHFVTSPHADTVWAYLNASVDYYQIIGEHVMPRLISILQEEVPEVLVALQRIRLSLQTLITLILSQCFLRLLNWPEVCNCLTLCVVGGPKQQANICACIIKHSKVQLCLMSHNNSTVWNVLRKQMASFRLHNYVL